MRQNATVLSILTDGRAEVSVARTSACAGNCAHCGSVCGGAEVRASAENAIGAEPGDSVVVESAAKRVMGIAFVVYILPFILFFAAYSAGAAAGFTNTAAIIMSVVGYLIGAGIAKLIDRAVQKRRTAACTIVAFSGEREL